MWATLDERIDTTDLLALARKSDGVAFVPGRAAYMDGRRGSSSMRLNFAGVPEAEIREGIRRIGRGVREQLGLLGTLTGLARCPVEQRAGRPRAGAAARRSPRRAASRRPSSWRDVVELPRRARTPHAGTPPRRAMSARRRVAVLKGGRSLERSVSLRSGAQVQDALTGLGHEVVALDVGEQLVRELLDGESRGRVRRAARARRGGRDRPGAARGARDPLHRLRAGGLHAGDRQAAGEAADARGRASRRRPSTRCARSRSRSSARRRRSSASRPTSASRWWSSPRAGARRWGSSSRATRASCRKPMVGAFSL